MKMFKDIKQSVLQSYQKLNKRLNIDMLRGEGRIAFNCGFCAKFMFLSDL